MKKEEADFIGSMNMCDEISNEAYKKIMCNCEVEESQPCENCISRQAVLDKKELVELEDGQSFYCINPKDVEILPSVMPKQTIWIPVSERLPENFQRVLVTIVNYNDDKVVRVAEYRDWCRTFQIKENREQWEVGEEGLLAWMPLPDPYQSDESVERG